jgi:hypothetical protein
MNETSKQQLSLLRQRIPVGLTAGLKLLERAGGDIDNAVLLFREEILQTLVSKLGLPEDIIQRHLVNNNYDIDATVKSIDEERFTLTERILKRYKNKEEALDQINFAVMKQHNIYRDGWLDFKQLVGFPKEVYCLMTITEWLLYVDYEGLDEALFFRYEEISNQLETVLQLSSLSEALRQAGKLAVILYEKYEVPGSIENYMASVQELKESEIYKQYEYQFTEQQNLVIHRLYDLIKANVHLFP